MVRLTRIAWLFSMFLSSTVFAQNTTSIVGVDELLDRLKSTEKPLLVANFWATWCGPCIKELPYFEEAYTARKDKIDLLLVNLDFADKVEKVNAFIARKNLTGEVMLIDNLDYNSWIDLIDTSWSGAIPATLLIDTRTGSRTFVEGEMDKVTLEKHIAEILQ